jgi:hypothetical protein
MQPFIMSIETTEGNSHRHGFHLGTDERLARQLIEERFAARVANAMPTVTIALMRDEKLVDVFDGRWYNDYAN